MKNLGNIYVLQLLDIHEEKQKAPTTPPSVVNPKKTHAAERSQLWWCGGGGGWGWGGSDSSGRREKKPALISRYGRPLSLGTRISSIWKFFLDFCCETWIWD
jgi:hypothetical protein